MNLTTRLIPVVIGIAILSIDGMARQVELQNDNNRNQSMSGNTADATPVVSIEELRRHPDRFYGKTVTVSADVHRILTDKAFTIQDPAWIKDPDVLVVSSTPMFQGGVSQDRSFDRHTKVRVTGTVQPFDRAKLESDYGPLHMEHYENRSFTRGPIIVVGVAQANKMEQPSAQLSKPTPEPEPPTVTPPPPPAMAPPAPEPAPPAKAESKELPKTAGELPLLVLIGMSALGAGLFRFK